MLLIIFSNKLVLLRNSLISINQRFCRWVDCVSITSSYFAFNVGYKYVTKYFDESAKDMVRDNNLKHILNLLDLIMLLKLYS